MHPGMYGCYQESKQEPERLGVGELTSDQAFQFQGVQFLQPAANAQVRQNLANLFLTGQIPAPVEGAAHVNAVAKQVAEQNNGNVSQSALEALKLESGNRPVGSVVLVNPLSASGTFVDIWISSTPEASAVIAGPGTDFAVFEPKDEAPAKKKEKKSKTAPMLVGAAAGGAIGFAFGGPPGALVGAGIGAAGGAVYG